MVMYPTSFNSTNLLSVGSTTIYLTNTGLIAANAVTLSFPPAEVRPQQTLTLPVRQLAFAEGPCSCANGWKVDKASMRPAVFLLPAAVWHPVDAGHPSVQQSGRRNLHSSEQHKSAGVDPMPGQCCKLDRQSARPRSARGWPGIHDPGAYRVFARLHNAPVLWPET